MDEIGAYKQRVLLRQIMKEKRNTLSDTAVNALSCQVIKGLRRLEPIKRANSIMSYCSIKNEVNLDLFNHEEWMAGRRILLPGWRDLTLRPLNLLGITNYIGDPWEYGSLKGILYPRRVLM